LLERACTHQVHREHGEERYCRPANDAHDGRQVEQLGERDVIPNDAVAQGETKRDQTQNLHCSERSARLETVPRPLNSRLAVAEHTGTLSDASTHVQLPLGHTGRRFLQTILVIEYDNESRERNATEPEKVLFLNGVFANVQRS
jgi:hypothetical protein